MASTVRQYHRNEKNNPAGHAFEATVLPHQDFLHHAALQFTRNVTEAEDLVQKTLTQAFTHWHTFRADRGCFSVDGNPARAWLYAILRNTFINDFRRQKRRRRWDISLEALGEDAGTSGGSVLLSPAQPMATPERAMVAKEELAAIRQAMRLLPEGYGTVLAMFAEEGLPYDEIAVRLKLPIGTVRSRLHRARKQIQRATSAWQIGIV